MGNKESSSLHGGGVGVVSDESEKKLSTYEKEILDALSDDDFVLVEKLLLESGLEVDSITDAKRESLLSIACRLGHHKCVRKLLQFGADPNGSLVHPAGGPASKKALTVPILEAARYGNVNSIKVLLDYKAKTNAKDEMTGRGALHLACEFGHAPVLRLLLHRVKTIDPNAGDGANSTPLHIASFVGPNSRQTRRRAQCVSQLARWPHCDVDVQNGDAETPLHIAASTGNELATAILLGAGANPTIDHHTRMDGKRAGAPVTRSGSVRRPGAPSVHKMRVIAFPGTPDITAKMAGHMTVSNMISEARAVLVMKQDAAVPPLEFQCRIAIRNYLGHLYRPMSALQPILQSMSAFQSDKHLTNYILYKSLVSCPNSSETMQQTLGASATHFLQNQTRTTTTTTTTPKDPVPPNKRVPKKDRTFSVSTKVMVKALMTSDKQRLHRRLSTDSDAESSDFPPSLSSSASARQLSDVLSPTSEGKPEMVRYGSDPILNLDFKAESMYV